MSAEPDLTAALDAYFQAHRERHLAELSELLRIPSVSALPAHHADMQRAADAVAANLRAAGVPQVEVLATAGHPAVWGAWPPPGPDAATVLIYGHYDVQPADPFDQWETPPFAPAIRDGRLYARGAADNKGNLLIPIKAVEAFTALRGRPPIGVIFLLEGEEEIGSPSLRALLAAERERFAADVVISADAVMWSPEQPSLLLGTKGTIGVQIDVRGTRRDVHSGLYGGIAPNALNGLGSLLGGMWTPDSKVLIDGFYDDVRPISPAEQADIDAAPFDDAAMMAELGVSQLAGEPGFSPLARNWARPTLDVNGLWGGFQGEGSKTVIPAEAHAKITCRLVPDQDPAHVIAAIARYVAAHLPPGISATVTPNEGSARAYVLDRAHPVLRVTAEALAASYGSDPIMMRVGGSLPIVEYFKSDLGLETIGLSWQHPDENLHAPNEFMRLESFDRGVRVYADLLARLAALPAGAIRAANQGEAGAGVSRNGTPGGGSGRG